MWPLMLAGMGAQVGGQLLNGIGQDQALRAQHDAMNGFRMRLNALLAQRQAATLGAVNQATGNGGIAPAGSQAASAIQDAANVGGSIQGGRSGALGAALAAAPMAVQAGRSDAAWTQGQPLADNALNDQLIQNAIARHQAVLPMHLQAAAGRGGALRVGGQLLNSLGQGAQVAGMWQPGATAAGGSIPAAGTNYLLPSRASRFSYAMPDAP